MAGRTGVQTIASNLPSGHAEVTASPTPASSPVTLGRWGYVNLSVSFTWGTFHCLVCGRCTEDLDKYLDLSHQPDLARVENMEERGDGSGVVRESGQDDAHQLISLWERSVMD